MKRLTTWLMILFTVLTVTRAARSAVADATLPPNILFIPIDDLNDWIGCLGTHPMVQTPNIDKLAASGTLFTNAHCQAPLCNPSRTSVLTGLRPSTTGVYSLDAWFRDTNEFAEVETLAQNLSRAGGYHTAISGKVFHVQPPLASRDNEFDDWGYLGSFGPFPKQQFVQTIPQPPIPFFTMYGNFSGVDWGVFPERDDMQEDSKVVDWAEGKLAPLSEPSDAPFFLACGIRHPHLPFFVTQKWHDLYQPSKNLLPPMGQHDRSDIPQFAWSLHWNLPAPRLAWLEKQNQLIPKVHLYLASISYADHLVGRLMNKLESTNQLDQTVVVLWSDHGYHLGEKEITGKNTLWERSTRVPLIIAGPGVTPGGVCNAPVELLDIYPTVLDLAGLPISDHLEGRSLVPQLRDATTPTNRPALTTHGPGNHTVRTDAWRYIRYADGSEELYDSKSDPNEWTNLAGDPAYAQTKAELADYLPKENAPPIPNACLRLVEYNGGQAFWEGEPCDVSGEVPAIYTPTLRYRTKRIGAVAGLAVLSIVGYMTRRIAGNRKQARLTDD